MAGLLSGVAGRRLVWGRRYAALWPAYAMAGAHLAGGGFGPGWGWLAVHARGRTRLGPFEALAYG